MSKFNEKEFEANENRTTEEINPTEVKTEKVGFLSKVGGWVKEHKTAIGVTTLVGVVAAAAGAFWSKKSDEGYEPEMSDYDGEVNEPENNEN